MKKLFFILAGIIVVICVANFALSQCGGSEDVSEESITDTTDTDGVISVENYRLKDFAAMDSVQGDVAWYETCIKLTGEVDTLEEISFEMVSNVFQVNTKIGGGVKTDVYCGKHANDNDWFDVKNNAFWLDDFDMTAFKDSIITFQEAFEKLQQANCPKPKSAYCTLRKQVGPINANPQYVFGNENRGLVYVDAVTGEVSTINPAFGKPELLKAVSPDSVLVK
jgi:hypothetical protein